MGKPQDAPVRMCIVCRERFPKHELTRFVFAAGDVPVEDARKVLPGRGFYVCAKEQCIKNMMRRLPHRR